MDLNVIHQQVRQSLNKDMGGYLTPEQIDRALDRAQMEEFIHLYGDDRKMPMPPVAYGVTYKVHLDLQPFKQEFTFTTDTYVSGTVPEGSGPDGVVTLPSNFLYITGMRTGNRPVKFISEDELPHRLSSVLRGPTSDRPVAIISSSSSDSSRRIQIFPQQGYAGTVYYLSRPQVPSWQGTISGRSVTYSEATSTQMLWNDAAIQRVIQRAIALLGETMRDELAITNYQKAQQ